MIMKEKTTNPRLLALKTLMSAERQGKYINLASDISIKGADMSETDTALFTSLVYGVTERKITLDHVISCMAAKGTKHIEPRVLCILRLGLYQLIYLDKIPSHAAVNETVGMCQSKGECSFVNAILRNYIRDGARRVSFPDKEKEPTKYLSLTYSVPAWICDSLASDYGFENAEGILSAFSGEAPSATLRVNTLKTTREAFCRALAQTNTESRETSYSSAGVKLSEGAKITALSGFDVGEFFVQDEASQICIEVLSPKPDETVIDTCSCPGSKSFGAAIEMQNKGKVYSFDLHENKLSLVEKSALRLGITIIECEARDGRNPNDKLYGKADRVICDVPCSGFGVMAKKPDIRYKRKEDVEALAPLGASILSESAKYLKDGGVLVYSTCTMRREENEEVVEAFLSTHPDFSLIPFEIKSKSEHTPDIKSEGMLTLMPHIHKTDGFFIAKLQKSKG